MDERARIRAAILSINDAFELGGARLPATPLAALGEESFRRAHGLELNYVGGAMANGIASVELVVALARAGMLGIYGAAGQPPSLVEAAILRLKAALGDLPFGVNLIHSPSEPAVEDAVARLLITHGVRIVEASAFLKLTLPVVRYRVHGIYADKDGVIVTPHKIIAKVSRTEIARPFLSPPPDAMLQILVADGSISAQQAEWARRIPVACDLTAEADSGGHTDNRPLVTLLPTMLALRDQIQDEFHYAERPRVGAAGGISTPAAAAAAFAMGAAYVVTGTVNQACIESGTSDLVRGMLAAAKQADTAMAPAADMFEMGVKVQVLKQGTMFPMRAAKLFELYSKYRTLDDLPETERVALEKQWFKAPLADVWEATKAYFAAKDPAQVVRAQADPRHKMALVFRSYLGQSSHWANRGAPDRKFDFQVWCGPAMGAFNEWARGSHFEEPAERRAVSVARNILVGAVVAGRAQMLKMQGLRADDCDGRFRPLPDAELSALIAAERT